ncbi:unknown [Subdoligranulum sp. CAG:314]|mgnify:FL=1|nr:unknown [Subdoligranulum sp. CAG:314]
MSFLFYFNSQMCPQPVLQGSFDCNFRILSKQKSLQNPQQALGQSALVRRGRIILCAASGCLRRRGASFVKQNFCHFVVDKRLLLTVYSFCFWGSGRTPCCSRDALSAALFPYRGIRRRQACRQRSKTPYCFLRKVCPPDI